MSHTAQYSHLVTTGWRRKLLPAGCSVVRVGSLLSYSCFNVDKVCKIFRITGIDDLATGAAILHYAFAVQLCFPDSRTVCFPVHEFITTVQRTRSRLHTMERLYWGIVSAGKICHDFVNALNDPSGPAAANNKVIQARQYPLLTLGQRSVSSDFILSLHDRWLQLLLVRWTELRCLVTSTESTRCTATTRTWLTTETSVSVI